MVSVLLNKCMFFICIIFLSFSTLANITISPQRVVLENGQRVAEVMLVNRSEKKEKFRILLHNQKMLENGSLVEAEEETGNDFFAKDKLIISPRQVVLEPKGTQKIRIMSRIKNGHPDGEYRTHLLVQNIPEPVPARNDDEEMEGLGVSIRAIFGMSVPVITRKGNLSAEVSISNPKFLSKEEGKFVEFRINRKGNKSVIGTVEVFSGSERLTIIKNLAVYLSIPGRIVTVQIPPEKFDKMDKNNFLITYTPDGTSSSVSPAEMRFNVSE